MEVGGKYELVRLLGRGGMGEVWEARHLALGTSLAVKLIDADLVSSTQSQRRFAREARIAARIESENAVRILDTGVSDDGRPYIAMELLRGESLGERLARVGTLSMEQCEAIVVPLAAALTVAHRKGIVHRDLKPDNVFLANDGGREIVKLLDFGIAKVLSDIQDLGLSVSDRTMAGAMLGTPPYMSPEQARGLTSIDHRTDLWSLGVLVFRALTGRDPFQGAWPQPLLVEICEAPLPVASAIAPGLPPAMDDWFRRAFARDVRGRFQSAAELAERFSEIARGDTPTQLLPPPIVDAFDETGEAQLVSFPHTVRMKIPVPLAAPPPSPTTGSSAPSVVSVPPPPSSSSTQPAPARRSRAFVAVAAGGVCVGIVLGLGAGALRSSRHSTSTTDAPPAVDARPWSPDASPDSGRPPGR